MTTETTSHTTQLLDTDQLRAVLLDLLTRANTALGFKPDSETAREYSQRLFSLLTEVQSLADTLVLARPALRVLNDAGRRIYSRSCAVGEIFNTPEIDTDSIDYPLDVGAAVLWGELEPVFPALNLDYTRRTLDPDEDTPF